MAVEIWNISTSNIFFQAKEGILKYITIKWPYSALRSYILLHIWKALLRLGEEQIPFLDFMFRI